MGVYHVRSLLVAYDDLKELRITCDGYYTHELSKKIKK